MNTMSFITHDIGPDDVAVSNKGIDVIGNNLRVIKPSPKELMMKERRRDRVREVETLKGGEATRDAGGFLA